MLIYVSTPTSNEPGCMHLHIAYKLYIKGDKNLRETIYFLGKKPINSRNVSVENYDVFSR